MYEYIIPRRTIHNSKHMKGCSTSQIRNQDSAH